MYRKFSDKPNRPDFGIVFPDKIINCEVKINVL